MGKKTGGNKAVTERKAGPGVVEAKKNRLRSSLSHFTLFTKHHSLTTKEKISCLTETMDWKTLGRRRRRWVKKAVYSCVKAARGVFIRVQTRWEGALVHGLVICSLFTGKCGGIARPTVRHLKLFHKKWKIPNKCLGRWTSLELTEPFKYN